ncbi:MAG: hypothetical protein ACRDNS_26200 [Trebonia sp.]
MTLLPEVRQELYETAARRAARPRRRLRVGVGPLVLAASSIVTLLVVFVVVTSLRHGAQTAPPSSAARGGVGASVSISALERRLALLRRPQTPADRTYPASLRAQRQPRLFRFVPGLARLAAVVDTPTVGAVRVFMIVRVVQSATMLTSKCGAHVGRVCTPASAGGGSAARRGRIRLATSAGPPGSALVSLLAIAGRGARTGQGPYLSAVGIESLRSGDLVTPPQRASQLDEPAAVASGQIGASGFGANPDIGINMSLVPDGVKRVRWVFSGAGYGISDPRPVTVYPIVHDNVAVAPVKAGEGPISHATWYGASGQVIASAGAGSDARQSLQLIDAVNASRRNALPQSLVEHFALFRSIAPTTPQQDPTMPLDIQNAGGGLALNEWQARYVKGVTGLDGPGLWITPGVHGICIDEPSGGGCGPYRPPRTLDSGGFTGGSTIAAPGEIGRSGIVRKWAETMSGIVPDSNATVTVLLASGQRRIVPVIDNVWETTVPRPIVGLIDHNAAGRPMRWSMR